jgi:hypothetical protein
VDELGGGVGGPQEGLDVLQARVRASGQVWHVAVQLLEMLCQGRKSLSGDGLCVTV